MRTHPIGRGFGRRRNGGYAAPPRSLWSCGFLAIQFCERKTEIVHAQGTARHAQN
jgi:hypothetical protein